MRYKVTIHFDSGESHGWVVESSTSLDALITFRHEYMPLSGQKMWRPFAQASKIEIDLVQYGLFEPEKS